MLLEGVAATADDGAAAASGLLHGKAIMITGASSGIGAAAARLFAAEGAAVVLVARRRARLVDIADDIRARGGRAWAVPCDVVAGAEVARAVRSTLDHCGRLDGVFNNAGWTPAGTRVHETDDAVFDEVVNVNLRGIWNCLKHQIPAMLESGGSIVNTASTAGVIATSAIAPYVAAKHAVIGLTKSVAKEYADRGIRANALVVGATRTELLDAAVALDPRAEAAFVGRSPQRRIADPWEVAEAAAWLCSERSSFVTGAAVPVDGGRTAV
ncbi:SDR family NAD(P)-dependent oxidoreductase [Streptomyces sp. NPDC020412]|uniref:SDR family NAD(P)-dependent oxidoreductase n=1 Tax=Streptomyces sp. NPDC020412 TaxID=3365073 RepID=UPI0037AABF3B